MFEMKQLKTKSYLDGEGNKCWEITTPDGEVFDAQPAGQKYLCCGLKGTLKTIKEAIVANEIGIGDETPHSDCEENERPTEQHRALWEHMSLGALLITNVGPVACSRDPKIMESLDGAGWLLKGDDLIGKDHPIDMDKLKRELERYVPIGETDATSENLSS